MWVQVRVLPVKSNGSNDSACRETIFDWAKTSYDVIKNDELRREKIDKMMNS